jgi:hypothetical protein
MTTRRLRRHHDGDDDVSSILRNLRDLEQKSQPWSRHQLRKVQKREKATTRWGRNVSELAASGALKKAAPCLANTRKLDAIKFRETIKVEAQVRTTQLRVKYKHNPPFNSSLISVL